MTIAGERRSLMRAHPFLVAYLAALAAVWLVTIATWTVRPGEPPDLHPLAQVLQYLLVVLAATLAALRLRVQPREPDHDAQFGFYDLRWSIPNDLGGQTFWAAMGIGVVAMLANIVLLVVADLLLGAAAGVGAYLGWLGAGVGAGALIGIFSALIALVVASVLRRRS